MNVDFIFIVNRSYILAWNALDLSIKKANSNSNKVLSRWREIGTSANSIHFSSESFYMRYQYIHDVRNFVILFRGV